MERIELMKDLFLDLTELLPDEDGRRRVKGWTTDVRVPHDIKETLHKDMVLHVSGGEKGTIYLSDDKGAVDRAEFTLSELILLFKDNAFKIIGD